MSSPTGSFQAPGSYNRNLARPASAFRPDQRHAGVKAAWGAPHLAPLLSKWTPSGRKALSLLP